MEQIDAVWVPCHGCEDWWCRKHEKHVFECDCPPLEEWETDPYGFQADGPAKVSKKGQSETT
jgi:hypothetical protein